MDDMQIMPPGTVVYGADDESIGIVESADDRYMVVDTGSYPPLLYIPSTAIFETREDGVYLTVTGADARHRGWDREPGEEMESLAEADESRYSAVQRPGSADEEFATLPAPADLVEGNEPAE